jgi:hypothetical protein
MLSALDGFLTAREIWQVPLAASLVAGALLGALGVYVVLRRTVFVSAALTQLSTLGMVVALLVEERLHIETEHADEQLAVAVAFSVVGALVLGAWRSRRLPAEASVGAGWVVASALVVLGTSRLVHASHDLAGMVFGNAVAVTDWELATIVGVFLLAAALHLLFEKELVFSSFDPETARASGVRVGLWDTCSSRASAWPFPQRPGCSGPCRSSRSSPCRPWGPSSRACGSAPPSPWPAPRGPRRPPGATSSPGSRRRPRVPRWWSRRPCSPSPVSWCAPSGADAGPPGAARGEFGERGLTGGGDASRNALPPRL